jgi:hypothetical protein
LKLPLWRLIAGIAVLGGFVLVMIMLAPVYIDNYRLRSYVRELAASPEASAQSDDMLRSEVVDRARQLDLPVAPSDVRVTRPSGKPRLEMTYKVKMEFAVYQVDLHMSAASR